MRADGDAEWASGRRRRGRPPTPEDERKRPVLVLFGKETLALLDRYVEHRRGADRGASRSEVIRQFVQEGLDRRRKKK